MNRWGPHDCAPWDFRSQFRPGSAEKFEQLAVHRLTEDSETFGGTPAASNDRLFIRSDKHLYCVAEQ